MLKPKRVYSKPMTDEEIRNRMDTWVIRRDDESCWEWVGSTDHRGYGKFGVNRSTFRAHRAAYQAYIGSVPEDLFVLHSCDNPACVNPHHLFLGTHTDNMQDMAAKGRNYRPKQKLTDEQVLEIAARYRAGETPSSLAKAFGISAPQACGIGRGRYWKHIVYDNNKGSTDEAA